MPNIGLMPSVACAPLHTPAILETASKYGGMQDLNLPATKKEMRQERMDKEVLVEITVSKEKGEIVYAVDCSSNILNEELEYYLEEIIDGICKWKPGVCEEKMQSFRGKIKKKPAAKR